MREIAIALLLVSALAVMASLSRLPFGQAVTVCAWIIGLGLLVGVPAGVWYHVALFREAGREGPLPKGWIWSPTELHPRLDGRGRGRVLPAFWIGAAGCGAIFFGSAILFVAAVLESVASR